ncbi:V-type proton ATPase subunit H [Trachymyrmex zeteki]|uniref:V-type proton ATPase subunit H n=1 Tax=Mycetomoellerius zeteki TaxID=64791 RepID=A0A151XDP3_9HYME|nr:PREDICTED: V-type proton ATPase subunit H isoform X1 [Trachymyrmex zeteki]KYQ58473.1 V-type proton ATPase subunit H [Trachymyrmex zeteki]
MVDRANSIKQMIPALPDEKIDMLAATSVLQQQAADIRNQRINWQSYFQSQMISKEDYDFIAAFDSSDAKTRENKLKENPHQAAKTFLNLLGHVSKDQTIQYILTMIDDMLQEDRSRVEIFREHSTRKRESVWGPFLNLLNRQDGFIMNMTSRIIAKLACWSHDLMEKTDLQFYLTWLKDQLKLSFDALQDHTELHAGLEQDTAVEQAKEANELHELFNPNNEYIQSVARCLQMMLRIDEYRFAFVSVDGISTLLSVLSGRVNFQVQYQLIFCLWVLTFNPLLAEKMNKFNVIPILADILSDSVKEKVTRIILAVFRNLIEKVEDGQVAKEHCIAMVQCKVLKQLSILCQRKFDDEDITDDIEFLNDKLQASVQDLSSFDEYSTEVKSGRLEWSPVHKSGKFWRENASRLNEKNYELLRILVHLLETSKDPLVLSVASFDIGEYVRHYPRGKHIIEQLGGKQRVMQLLGHEDPNVRYEALLAVQKLMVHNWEYLGKQLEKEQTGASGAPNNKSGVQVPAKA